MTKHPMPNISPELARRIRLVRRDVSDLLFHFTRGTEQDSVMIEHDGGKLYVRGNAYGILQKILYQGLLLGTSTWTYGENTVCFTEAPLQEFNSIFSLVTIAASKDERPRYEPYGIAVPKRWLFEQGGRPVIYDHPSALEGYPTSLKYRFAPYDPANGIDFTWEREWRVRTDQLRLDPKHALVVVPTSDEAFHLVYNFASEEPDYDDDGTGAPPMIMGIYHEPKWLAVSLDMFGYSPI